MKYEMWAVGGISVTHSLCTHITLARSVEQYICVLCCTVLYCDIFVVKCMCMVCSLIPGG